MLTRLHHRPQAQAGFTLIELLVVILIVGILAAVAIPTFLSQTNKASDSNVMSALNTAHLTEDSYRTSNGGYAGSATALTTLEPSLSTPAAAYSISAAYFAASGTASSTTGYQISGTDPRDGVTYALKYDATSGVFARTCTSPNTGACSSSGTWGS